MKTYFFNVMFEDGTTQTLAGSGPDATAARVKVLRSIDTAQTGYILSIHKVLQNI